MKQRDELFSNAEHEAELAKRFTESCSESHAQRDRGVHFGVAGCGLTSAAHRRSKMQRERREAEREEGARAAWPCAALLCFRFPVARAALDRFSLPRLRLRCVHFHSRTFWRTADWLWTEGGERGGTKSLRKVFHCVPVRFPPRICLNRFEWVECCSTSPIPF